LAGTKRPSFLKSQKEQKRKQKAQEKREARLAKRSRAAESAQNPEPGAAPDATAGPNGAEHEEDQATEQGPQ